MTAGIDEAREALEKIFGFASFLPGQQEILEAILAGSNILAVMPTGSGKSLCYQLPALLRPGLTIVVSPLIALMRDQVQKLEARGIAAAALNSSNSGEVNAAIESGLRRSRYRLLYAAPERLARPDTQALLREAGVTMLAIDEAHCVSLWGHDFRPEYSGLAQAARSIGNLQIVAVTATADGPTRADIVAKLFPSEPKIFVRSFDRPNIHLAVRRRAGGLRQIAAMVKRHKGESGIIYCASRKSADKISMFLSEIGVAALPYHAGLDSAVRSAHEDEFLRHDGAVIVATVAFGMGIDKPDVRFVCHANLPQSLEAYYQEIGRAGRDGLPAESLILFRGEDILLRERQIGQSAAPLERQRRERRKLKALAAFCESASCRRQMLLAAFGEESAPCGNCDACRGGTARFRAQAAAQGTISAIRRTSARLFSGGWIKPVTERAAGAINSRGRVLMELWDAGKEGSPSIWRSLIDQLRRAALMSKDRVDCERWLMAAAEREALSDTASPEPDGDGSPARSGFGEEKAQPAEAFLTAREHRLLAALKAKRLEVAKREKQPAFAIFGDGVLIEMARRWPQTGKELLQIPGVEPPKAARYGAIFLESIANHTTNE